MSESTTARHNLHRIAVGEIPFEGQRVAGTLQEDIFALPEGHPQVRGPLVYDLTLSRHEDLLLATGSLQTTFDLECVRCLQKFPYKLELRGHTVEFELSGEETIDLTESIRDDILLSLPGYPRCEDSSLGSIQCNPGAEVFSKNSPAPEGNLPNSPGSESNSPGQNVWGALDNLKSLNEND